MGVTVADPQAFDAAGRPCCAQPAADLLALVPGDAALREGTVRQSRPGPEQALVGPGREVSVLNRPEGRNAPDYASKIHIVSAPAYYHNYMMGELFASQVHHAIARDVLGGVDRQGELRRQQGRRRLPEGEGLRAGPHADLERPDPPRDRRRPEPQGLRGRLPGVNRQSVAHNLPAAARWAAVLWASNRTISKKRMSSAASGRAAASSRLTSVPGRSHRTLTPSRPVRATARSPTPG